ncbi:hypothetical protein M8C21_000430 [Ambrosia artemisiifolia]|uniref:Uncharacterized protein n=1 Tax=Ambrosia artemisiifolia TaxID=4212 RepID=A0AAD5CS52_AMBAR|nr:hypothetical protein M8C21_000430 [Ambrosia artemisiifolia]
MLIPLKGVGKAELDPCQMMKGSAIQRIHSI